MVSHSQLARHSSMPALRGPASGRSVLRLGLVLAAFLPACTGRAGPGGPAPVARPDTVVVVDTVRVETQDAAARMRMVRLEMQLLERDAQIAELRLRLDEAIREVVRSLAKLQMVASRAEAASAIAEARLAYETLKNQPGARGTPEEVRARQLLEEAGNAFGLENYGGAIYLATQVKGLVRPGVIRSALDRMPARTGEQRFASPIALSIGARGNLRDGPGLEFDVLDTMNVGDSVTGFSYFGEWVRVTDGRGRSGWIHLVLLDRGS